MSALHRRKALCLTLAGASAVLALSACGSSRQPQTYQTRNLGDAANANLGVLGLRAVSVLPPPDSEAYRVGADATLVFTIANQGAADDDLVAIRTATARSVVLGGRAGSTSPAPQPSLAATASPAASPAARPGRLTIPAYGQVNGASALLLGLTKPLRSGNYLTVTFVFRNGGTINVDVPVEVGSSPAPRSTVMPTKEPAAE